MTSPNNARFEPNDRRFYPIYEAIAEAAVPALFHTGQTGIGAGLPGGHRIKLRYSDPMLLDDVAADFPELTIVMAHPAVPWVDAQISIASHKSNVYIDDRLMVDTHGMLDRTLLHHPDVLEMASEFGDPYKVLAPVSHEAHGSGSTW